MRVHDANMVQLVLLVGTDFATIAIFVGKANLYAKCCVTPDPMNALYVTG